MVTLTAPVRSHTGDLDGDGDVDVIGAAKDANQVVYWRNDGGNPGRVDEAGGRGVRRHTSLPRGLATSMVTRIWMCSERSMARVRSPSGATMGVRPIVLDPTVDR